MNRFIILMLIIGTLIAYQSNHKLNLISTYNKGGYFLEAKEREPFHLGKDSAAMFGYVRDLETKQHLISSTITIGCSTVIVNKEDGYYQITGKVSDQDIFISCVSIGYRTVEVKPFKLKSGETVRIDFYLTPDDRPLINCEGAAR